MSAARKLARFVARWIVKPTPSEAARVLSEAAHKPHRDRYRAIHEQLRRERAAGWKG